MQDSTWDFYIEAPDAGTIKATTPTSLTPATADSEPRVERARAGAAHDQDSAMQLPDTFPRIDMGFADVESPDFGAFLAKHAASTNTVAVLTNVVVPEETLSAIEDHIGTCQVRVLDTDETALSPHFSSNSTSSTPHFPAQCEDVQNQIKPGVIILNAVHSHPEVFGDSITSLADSLENATGSEININSYIKEPNRSALAPHSDDYDVFVMQISGVNQWTICGRADAVGNSARRVVARRSGFDAGPANTTGLVCQSTLTEAGDVMFLPRGVLHSAVAIGDNRSVHLTVGILATRATWRDVVSNVIRRHHDPEFVKTLEDRLKTKAYALNADGPWDQFPAAATTMIPPSDVSFPDLHNILRHHTDSLCGTDPRCGFFNDAELSRALQESLPHHTAVIGPREKRQTVQGCTIGTQSARFQCPDGSVHDKNLFSRAPNIGCDCDSVWRIFRRRRWGSCDCDIQSPNFGRCETVCSMCSCPRGQRFQGCSIGSYYQAGQCVDNAPGDYCSTGSEQLFCAGGNACLQSRCCNSDVRAENCQGCEASTGNCIAWAPGYTGALADRCVEGTHFMLDGECVPLGVHGDSCGADNHCSSGSCKGGMCCGPDAAHMARCVQCGAYGECTACDEPGLNANTTCTWYPPLMLTML